MRPLPLRPMLLCLALLLACGHAVATESRQMGPDGSGSCPESAATGSERTDEADGDEANAAAQARRTPKAKPAAAATPQASGGRTGGTPPRFHSFLPGMFR